MNELEYNVLIAPLDLTKVDKNSRKRKPRRGDKRKDNTNLSQRKLLLILLPLAKRNSAK